jgi:hypothetical protein
VIQEYEIDSQLAQNDAVVALLRCVGPPRRIPLIPFRKPKNEFEGVVSPEGFRIKRVRSTNGILIFGNISPKGTGTRVSVSIRPSIPSVVLSVLFVLTYFVVVVGRLVTSPNGRPEWFFSFGFIGALILSTSILVAFGVALLNALGKKETRKALPLLDEIFQGHAIFKQSDQHSMRRFRVPLLWFTEALGLVAIALGIVCLVVFFRPPRTSVMGRGQVDSRFLSNGVALTIMGVVIARDALGRLRSRIERQ